jgi:AI-2 transport protein TqsA
MTGREESDRGVQTACLILLTIMAGGTALYFLRPVVVPFLLAIVIFYALQPMIDWQRRHWGFPRALAVVGVGIVSVALLTAMGFLTAAFVVKLREHLPMYEAQLKQLSARVAATIDFSRWGLNGGGAPMFDLSEAGGRQLLTSVLSSGVELISSGGLVVLFVLFMLSGARSERAISPLRTEIDTAIRAYIFNMVGISALTGLLVGIALAMLNVDFALEFGVLAFLLNFIPTIGSMIATILPLPVILLSPQLSMTERILALALPAAIQTFLGSVVQPRMMGQSQDLHPVTVLLAMLFFGTIWGVVGAVLGVPLAGVTRIVFSKLDETKIYANWMAGNIDSSSQPQAAQVGS